MLLWNLPRFIASDCTYWEEHDRVEMKVEPDEEMAAIVNALVTLYYEKEREVEAQRNLYVKETARNSSLRKENKALMGKNLVDQKVQEVYEREIKPRMKPKDLEVPVFWIFLVVLFVAGLILGFSLSNLAAVFFPPAQDELVTMLVNTAFKIGGV